MVGSFQTADEIERLLQDWLTQYVNANVGCHRRFPRALPAGRRPGPGAANCPARPGSFGCVVQLQPHYQLDDVSGDVPTRHRSRRPHDGSDRQRTGSDLRTAALQTMMLGPMSTTDQTAAALFRAGKLDRGHRRGAGRAAQGTHRPGRPRAAGRTAGVLGQSRTRRRHPRRRLDDRSVQPPWWSRNSASSCAPTWRGANCSATAACRSSWASRPKRNACNSRRWWRCAPATSRRRRARPQAPRRCARMRRASHNGTAFDDLRDVDDLLAGSIEVLTTTGKYYWIPDRAPDQRRTSIRRSARATCCGAARRCRWMQGPDGDV